MTRLVSDRRLIQVMRRPGPWPPILAWRLRLLAPNITGIGWQPLTLMAGSFGVHSII